MLRPCVDTTSDATIEIESEEALLGSLLLDPGGMVVVGSLLSQSDFASSACGKLFAAMLMLHEANRPFGDIVLLVSHLKSTGEYEAVGGAAFIASLSSRGYYENVEFYVENILRASRLREIKAVMNQAINRIEGHDSEGVVEPDAIIEWLDARISGVGLRRVGARSMNLKQLGEQRIKSVLDSRSSATNDFSETLPSGLDFIDSTYAGFKRSNNIVIAARSGDGKSALAKQISSAMSLSGLKVRYVSLEMEAIEVSDRVFAERCGINGKYLSANVLVGDEEATLTSQIGDAEETFVIDDPVGRDATWERIAAEARLQHATTGLDVFVLDYIQLVGKSNPRVSDYDHLTAVSHGMKSLARELGIVVLTLSQLNRAADSSGDRRMPRLSDLSMTSAIGNDADAVLFLHRKEEHSNQFILAVGKWRGDTPIAVPVELEGKFTRFIERD